MECLRCGAKLKDNAVVCKKCGFIVKGAKKLDTFEPTISFEERIQNASEEEMRAMLLAIKAKRDGAANPDKNALPPEVLAARSGKRWATTAFVAGLLSLIFVIVPGVNVIVSLLLFVLAFIGFGKSNGYRTNLAMVGVILTIVSIAASWIYNAYASAMVGEMLGITPAAEGAGTVADPNVGTDPNAVGTVADPTVSA